MNPFTRFFSSLMPGARSLIIVITGLFLAQLVGELSRIYSLVPILGLTPARVKMGLIWPIVTHALLPVNVLDLLFTAIVIVMVGTRLEQLWSRMEFWSFCLLCAGGTGIAAFLLLPSQEKFFGGSGMAWGLLVGWLRLFGHERMPLMGGISLTVRQMTLIFLGISLIMTWMNNGWRMCLIIFAGALTAWLYLTLQWRRNMARTSRKVSSQRINRLEL